MRGNSLSCWLLAITLFATVSVGCRAPYPTYNPYGVYGNPCVPPPGTGVYNPTGQPNQYYQGAPNTGVLPPNPYGAPAGYPTGYAPQQAPPQNWAPTQGRPVTAIQPVSNDVARASANGIPEVESDATIEASSRVAATRGSWSSVNENRPELASTTPALDVSATYGNVPTRVASTFSQFDGFQRN